MSNQRWTETLAEARTAGTSRASFTTAVSILPPEARCPLPANFMYPGRRLRITAQGRISNVVTAQPTFAFTVLMGPSSNIVVFNGGNMTCSTTAHTTVPWWLSIDLTCRATGESTNANLMGQGKVESQAFVVSGATADSANTHTTLLIPNTAPTVGTGFDSSVAMIVDLFAACGTNNAGNLIQLEQYVLESLN